MSFKSEKSRLQGGLICKEESGRGPSAARGLGCAQVLLFYLAFWGGLCSMASISTLGVLPLAVGGAYVLAFGCLPGRRALQGGFLAAGVIAAILLFCAGWRTSADGVKLILNRMFAASEARQAYTYEMFTISAEEALWQSCMRYALLPLGLFTGTLCAFALRAGRKLPLIVLFLAFAGWTAYLGVSPTLRWSVLLAAALAFALTEPAGNGGRSARLLRGMGWLVPFLLICAVVMTAFPDEDSRLSAWDERARDAVALSTLAYADQSQAAEAPETAQAPEDQQLYQEEETPGELEGDQADWLRPLSVGLVILLFALLLFLPAALSDHLKKRRAKQRQGLDDPDNNVSVRAMFLYTLRWLCLAGVTPGNVPYSGYAGQVEQALSHEIRVSFEQVLPLWQEAAYSSHAVTDQKREQMREFMEEVQQTVWARLSRKERFLAAYVYAL